MRLVCDGNDCNRDGDGYKKRLTGTDKVWIREDAKTQEVCYYCEACHAAGAGPSAWATAEQCIAYAEAECAGKTEPATFWRHHPEPGELVTLTGLVASASLNGTVATIVAPADAPKKPSSGRVAVRLPDRRVISVKLECAGDLEAPRDRCIRCRREAICRAGLCPDCVRAQLDAASRDWRGCQHLCVMNKRCGGRGGELMPQCEACLTWFDFEDGKPLPDWAQLSTRAADALELDTFIPPTSHSE